MTLDGRALGVDVVLEGTSQSGPTTVDPAPQEKVATKATNEKDHLLIPKRLIEVIPSNPLRAALDGSMFQVVVFAIFISIALVGIGRERARILLELAGAVQEVSMRVVSWAMVIAPLAVFGLLAEITIQLGWEALIGTSFYVATVLLGLLSLVVFHFKFRSSNAVIH